MNIKNVFLISMDSIRPDYLDIFKKNKNTQETPGLQEIMKNGIAFNNCIIHNVGTPGSHVCMITGAYPFHTGVRNNFAVGMSRKVNTIQEILKVNGWITTTFVNHKHLTHLDFHRGSDFFYFNPLVKGTGTELHRCKDWFTDANDTKFRVKRKFDFLNELEPDAKKFFFIHMLDCHLDLGDEKYKDNIKYVDKAIGELYKHIYSSGQLDQTLFILTADHGEGQPGETRYELTGGTGLEVFDTSIKVPLIISHPEIKEKGIVYDDVQVRDVDIVPTILDLVEVKKGPGIIDGVSLKYYTGNLEGGKEVVPDTRIAYCETYSPGWFMKAWGTTQYELTFKVHDWACIRYDNAFKVMYNADDGKLSPHEVYDLQEDPEERTNIIETEKGQKFVELANKMIKDLIPEQQEDVSQAVTKQMLVDAGKFSYEKNKHRTGMYKPKSEGGLL